MGKFKDRLRGLLEPHPGDGDFWRTGRSSDADLPLGAVGVFGPSYGTSGGKLPTFLRWIEAWVEESLADLPKVQAFERKRR